MRYPHVICLAVLFCCAAIAQDTLQPSTTQPIVPRMIRFSGQVRDASGTVGITFTLHKSQQDNATLWIETQNVKVDASGKYTVLLGATKSIPMELFTSGEAQWLGIHVAGQAENPRVLLVSVPYALKAAEAETLAGHSATEFITSEKLNSAVQQQLQQNGINGSPAGKKSANGTKPSVPTDAATNFVDNTTNQVVGITQNGSGMGLFATATTGTAVRANSTGTAIYGVSSGTGSAAALQGTSTSSTGKGIYGYTTAATGLNYGVVGSAVSPQGVGAYGYNTSATGATVGLWGAATSSAGIGVKASASATSGASTGILSNVRSPAGTALVLQNPGSGMLISGQSGASNTQVFSVTGAGAITGTGGNLTGTTFYVASNTLSTVPPFDPFPAIEAHGYSNTHDGESGFYGGLFYGGDAKNGLGNGGSGVWGRGGDSTSGLGGDGVDGVAGSGPGGKGLAGQFLGDIYVSGAITAGTKDFKIDHPLDPANKLFYHASIESSEMKNLYDGTITTDRNGMAVVHLPDWFEAVNGDFRYQLTVIGDFAQAIIARKIADHQFSIRTNKPNVEVSWQVTGVRRDAFAKAHPLTVEVEKPAMEKGYYLRPELYGAPPERQVEYVRHPEMMRKLHASQRSEVPAAE